MIQVRAEPTFFHSLRQVGVSGRNDAGGRLNLPCPTQPVIRLAVEHAKKLGLHARIQFADLVQKQRPAGRCFKQALLDSVGSAEGALFVAEQLAFNQVFRESGAVHVYERPVFSRRIVVDGARHQLFAHAALSLDQNRGIGSRNLLGLFNDPLHRTRCDDGRHTEEVQLPRVPGVRAGTGASQIVTFPAERYHSNARILSSV